MNYKIPIIAVLVALFSIAIPSVAYISMFGLSQVYSHEKWGLFGDFFGGLLNPLFAMFAFFALLWAISIQLREFKSASRILNAQLVSAKKQLEVLRDARTKDDLIHVIKDLDSRIQEMLGVVVTVDTSQPILNIGHMVREARRLRSVSGDSPAYNDFVTTAQSSGSVVESSIQELVELISKMRRFLGMYSRYESHLFSPIILYYANKCYVMFDLLEDIGVELDDMREYFATVSDSHG